jgi:ATP-dependent DNA helicase RecQ
MPKSLEHYQQESGRAGRDGLEAECVILYSGADYGAWKRLVGEEDTEGGRIAIEKLTEMYNYCSGVTCRHRALVQYFGQDLGKENCGACDVCLGDLDAEPDSRVIAQKILSCVVRLKERFGGKHTAQVLVGSSAQNVLKFHHERLSTYGLLSDRKEKIVRDWTEQLVGQGCLEKYGEFNCLRVTEKGRRVLKGEVSPMLLKPADRQAQSSPGDEDSWEGVDRGLFESLRDLRRRISQEHSIPAFAVFSDRALRDMARKRPSSREHFLSVHGVGETKAAEFGDTFTSAIRRYCESHNLELNLGTGKTQLPGNGKTPSEAKKKAFELFGSNRSVQQVAQALGRAESTTQGYLVEFLAREGRSDPTPWVSPSDYEAIYGALLETETSRLTPVFEKLGEKISYESIRIVRACVENGGRPHGHEIRPNPPLNDPQ